MFEHQIIGWDIGGAHLKAVLLAPNSAPQALQMPCELWRGLNQLEAAFNQVFQVFGLNQKNVLHAVTMTGELVDLFENRQQGVLAIAQFSADFLGANTQFYAAGHGFVSMPQVAAHAAAIASANWHASASLLAKHVKNALFVDIGSTTTDIVPIAQGRVALQACSDAQRMACDSLVYTGVVRTPLMALAQKIPVDGVETNVAAEYFATIADVYRLTGDLRTESDMAQTADGKGKTALESARRLARMVGHDVEDKALESWHNLALSFKKRHMQPIQQAMLKHLNADAPMIGAGAGAFLVAQIAKELHCEYLTLSQVLAMDCDESLSVCFPAYAVAKLAEYAAN